MRNFVVVFLLVYCSFCSYGQQYILSGKVTDKRNKPVNNAAIQVISNSKLAYAYTDTNGLYFTEMLPEGLYEVNIVADSVMYLSKVTVKRPATKNKFYNFKLMGKDAVLTEATDDPFMEAAMVKAQSGSRLLLQPGQHYQIIEMKRDSADKKKQKVKGK